MYFYLFHQMYFQFVQCAIIDCIVSIKVVHYAQRLAQSYCTVCCGRVYLFHPKHCTMQIPKYVVPKIGRKHIVGKGSTWKDKSMDNLRGHWTDKLTNVVRSFVNKWQIMSQQKTKDITAYDEGRSQIYLIRLLMSVIL